MKYGRVSSQDWEQISAYLDGQFTRDEAVRFQSRLNSDAELSAAFEEIRRTRGVLRSTPKLRAPRNYMIQPDAAFVRSRRRHSWFQFPSFSFASAVTGLLLLVLLVSDLVGVVDRVLPSAGQSDAAPMMAVEMASDTVTSEALPGETTPEEEPQMGIQELRPLETPSLTEDTMRAFEFGETELEEGDTEEATTKEAEDEEEMMEAAAADIEEPAGGGSDPPQLGLTQTPTGIIEAFNALATDEAAEETAVSAETDLMPTLLAIEESIDGAQPAEEQTAVQSRPDLLGLFVIRIIEVALAAMTVVFLALAWIYRRKLR